jgi:hypothetical protein
MFLFNHQSCFHLQKSKLLTHYKIIPSHCSYLLFIAVILLLFISMNLSNLSTYYKLSHTVLVLLWMAYFTLFFSMCQNFLILTWNHIPWYAYTTFVYSFVYWLAYGLITHFVLFWIFWDALSILLLCWGYIKVFMKICTL